MRIGEALELKRKLEAENGVPYVVMRGRRTLYISPYYVKRLMPSPERRSDPGPRKRHAPQKTSEWLAEAENKMANDAGRPGPQEEADA